jgi:hypothetical protein
MCRGLTLTETLVVVVSLAVLLATILPALGQVWQTAPVTGSWNNLRTLHAAMECYAADWSNRQFTAVPDDLGVVGGDCEAYADEFGCYPPLFAGVGCDGLNWAAWGSCAPFSSLCASNIVLTRPINLDPEAPYGVYRIPQMKGIHDYVNGRFHDPTFFAPLDTKAYLAALPAFDQDCEFVETAGTIPSSYALSPAAMYHPDVFRAPSEGGFQHPDTFDDGYRSPAVTQAEYAQDKTWMIEHNWLRNPPAACNPDYEDPFGGFSDLCDPYLFNHGASAAPLALFFDGSVERLRTGAVVVDDARMLKMTGGVDGLWSRDTPFGESGYFGELSFDGTIVSHHILTTGGIRGRDTLRRAAPNHTGHAPIRSLDHEDQG